MHGSAENEVYSIEVDPFFAQDLAQMAKARNYHRWQVRIIAPFVKGKILEVGGGIGNFTPELARLGSEVISLEPNEYCSRQLVEKTKGLANVQVVKTTAENLEAHVPADYQADTVVCMNVLEHIQDDVAAVRTFARRLKVGGTLVLLIPALPWLFGEIDRRLGHYRRYTKKTARAALREAGFETITLRYFNFIGLWGWFWNTQVTKRLTQSDGQIRVFDGLIVPWQSRLESVLPPPIGQSLLVVGQKCASGPKRPEAGA